MNNYDIIVEESKKRFLQWDQNKMIEKYSLRAESEYLYVSFCDRPYRIHRGTAAVERMNGGTFLATGFNEVMSIFDLLCYGKDGAVLSGQWVSLAKLAHHVPTSSGNNNIFAAYEKLFDLHVKGLREALDFFGYEPFSPGDVGCVFHAFPCLPIVFQFWQSDDEFPPSINFLWDSRTLDFIHYETIFYIEHHWLQQIAEEIQVAK